jgi:predicted AAA+ superfamily ATPase
MPEVAILVGLRAAGKTTFYRQTLAATHEHVSKDTFRELPMKDDYRALIAQRL